MTAAVAAGRVCEGEMAGAAESSFDQTAKTSVWKGAD